MNNKAKYILNELLWRGIAIVAVLYIFSLLVLWTSNKKIIFWEWIIFGIGLTVALLFFNMYVKYLKSKHLFKIYTEIDKNQAGKINNFIRLFGTEGNSEEDLFFRGYSFSKERISDLERELINSGVNLHKDEIYQLLILFIQEKEANHTKGSI